MKHHTRVYFSFFGYQIPSDAVCECCGNPAVDVHHIDARGMGGDPTGKKDLIENLMGLCRKCHDDYGDVPEYVPLLTKIHLKFMEINGLAIKFKEYIKRITTGNSAKPE